MAQMFRRKTGEVEQPLSYLAAKEIAYQVYRFRNGMEGRDSDGNSITVSYPSVVVDEAARAASAAPCLAASIDELERIFVTAEQCISTAVHTS